MTDAIPGRTENAPAPTAQDILLVYTQIHRLARRVSLPDIMRTLLPYDDHIIHSEV